MSEKTALLEAIAGQNRGLLASEIDRVKVLAAIERLEDHNPTPKPLEAADLLAGNWRLLYTTNQQLLGFDRFPLLTIGQIYQSIRPTQNKVYNIAEIIGLPFLEGLVSVAASYEPVDQRRVNVKFQRSIISLQRFINYRSPGQFIEELEAGKKFFPLDFSIENRNQQGWLETTYLDSDLRLGRGNEGNVFVLVKD